MSISDIKHKGDMRALIPSKEQAGMENGNETVQERLKLDVPLNPVVNRGQDPELYWLNKYGKDNTVSSLQVDIRSLYRQEHISPKALIDNLYKVKRDEQQFDLYEMFGSNVQLCEEDKIPGYYKHTENWSNRLIMGDSLLVMTSLLEREGMAGKVQTIYFDPPYGIKYGGNWQMKLNNRTVKDGNDDHLTGQGEQIKAYRDTWELGIHSYLSYLRDRLLVAKELLTESGSCFVQISDENVHLVRCLMDEVFGSENFVSEIVFQKTGSETTEYIPCVYDYIVLYAKSKPCMKFKPLYSEKMTDTSEFTQLINESFDIVSYGANNKDTKIPDGYKLFKSTDLNSRTGSANSQVPFNINGRDFYPRLGASWRTSIEGLNKLNIKKRILLTANTPRYIHFFEDFPYSKISNIWNDLMGASERYYVVQTNLKVLQRCILMTTDPGDLVLDPTMGSGTSAYVAEQWGRRWITVDTSRIAVNIGKTRLMTALYPYYKLYDEQDEDIRHGFQYKKVPHITLKSLANDEPPEEETLFDQPLEDKKKFRVAGPFTVETLQSLDVINPADLFIRNDGDESFEQRVFEHLQSSGIKNGIRNEHAKFIRVDSLPGPWLHAEGFYPSARGETKAYIHIGPKFGTVSKQAVSEAIIECRAKGDADWLIILGFSFDSEIHNDEVTTSMGRFALTKVRMHDDLLQDGLLKRDPKAASFVTIGEPEIDIIKADGSVHVEIKGMDIYDPITDEVKPRDIHDIAYWMVDDDYDGSNFMVRQVFFCGGDKDEFAKWKKNLDKMAVESARKKLNQTLKIEIDEDAFDRLYGHKSHPITVEPGKQKKIAVRVVSQFGEECTKVMTV